jgi:CDP-4-dehydro-6-deoxyglucose reductase
VGIPLRIRLAKSNVSFTVMPDQSLLDAALGASLNLPHSCKGGNCGSCRARLLQGEVYYPNGAPLGLSDAEVADGFVLLCQARARSDLSIETVEITTAGQARVKRLPARIERAVPLSHDVMALYLKLPAAEAFEFEAGQYVDILLTGGRRRSFSIASPPHESQVLELHVRRVAGGEFSAPLFDEDTRSSHLTLEGPFGQFAYRPSVAPMLLVGGGTGLAPLLSILRHVIRNGIERDMTLYWGVRSERDLYAEDALEELMRRAVRPPVGSLMGARPAHFDYVPVLSEPSPTWSGSRGRVHEAVLRDVVDLKKYDIYAAGPPAMIEILRQEFGARGVAADRLYFDSFDYAPDSALRHRTSADTRS